MKINIAETILAIKSDAQVSVSDDDINTLEWHDDNPTNITNEQILAKQTELQPIEDAKAQAKIDAKASGKQKLLDLGLSEEEVKALIGI